MDALRNRKTPAQLAQVYILNFKPNEFAQTKNVKNQQLKNCQKIQTNWRKKHKNLAKPQKIGKKLEKNQKRIGKIQTNAQRSDSTMKTNKL
jgi:hypothetical protein